MELEGRMNGNESMEMGIRDGYTYSTYQGWKYIAHRPIQKTETNNKECTFLHPGVGSISLWCVWEPFFKWWSILWNRGMSWKDRDSISDTPAGFRVLSPQFGLRKTLGVNTWGAFRSARGHWETWTSDQKNLDCDTCPIAKAAFEAQAQRKEYSWGYFRLSHPPPLWHNYMPNSQKEACNDSCHPPHNFDMPNVHMPPSSHPWPHVLTPQHLTQVWPQITQQRTGHNTRDSACQ